jgi:hypothetical protein
MSSLLLRRRNGLRWLLSRLLCHGGLEALRFISLLLFSKS